MKKAGLLELFLIFAKIGVMTFGGGYAMLPILQREIVENKKWATDEDLANYFAIGQCTPGVIAVNTATFIGYKNRGKTGGVAATLGVVFPSLVIISTLAGVIAAFADNIYVKKAFMGIRACVCVLILSAIVKLWKSAVTSKLTLTVFIIGLALSLFSPIPLVLLIVIDIIFGLIIAVAELKSGKGAGT